MAFRWPTVLLLAGALVLHAVLLWPTMSGASYDFDGVHVYLPFARALLDEGWSFFATERSIWAAPGTYLYPALFGASAATLKQVNFVLSFATLLLVARTAWVAHSRTAGIVAAFLFAASPLLRPFLTPLASEPEYFFLCAMWIWALAECLARPRAVFVLLGALALGFAVLTRVSLFYLVPVLAAGFGILWWKTVGADKAAARGAFALHALALVLPVAVLAKNLLLFGLPFFATGAGAALYLGNYPLTGGYDPPYVGLFHDVGSVIGGPNQLTLAADAMLRAAARLAVADQSLGELAAMHARKLAAFVFVSNAEPSAPVLLLRSWRIALGVLAVAGAIALRRRWLGWVIVATLAYQVAVHMPVLYTHRYSVGSMDLWLTILAAVGLGTLVVDRRPRRLLAWGSVLVVSLLAGFLGLRYGGLPQPDVFQNARLPVWEGQPLQRTLSDNSSLEVPVRDAPRFHPWANHVLVLETAITGAAACGWVRLSYKRDADPAFGASVSRYFKPDGVLRRYQIGMSHPMSMNAEGILRLEFACPGGGTLDLRRAAVFAPMGGMDYRARVLSQPLDPKLER